MSLRAETVDVLALPRTPRWTGVLAVIIAVSALIAGRVQDASGSERITVPPLAWAPWELWLAIGVLGVCVLALRGVRALAAADALAVACAWVCVIPVFSGVAQAPRVIQTIQHVEGLPDRGAQWVTLVVLLIGIAVGILGVIIMAAAWRRWATLNSAALPRSPFRVEALVLIGAFAVVALVQGVGDLVSGADSVAWIVAFIVPVSLTLALSLRRSGWGSIWIAGLLSLLVVDDVVRLLLASELDFYRFTPMSQGWANLLLIALIIVVLLWNSVRPATRTSATDGTLESPLDPWSAGAFVLAFVPLLSIPAVVLGHLSYEQTMGTSAMARSRLLAGAAIVIGMVNVIAIIALYFGIIELARRLLSSAVGGL